MGSGDRSANRDAFRVASDIFIYFPDFFSQKDSQFKLVHFSMQVLEVLSEILDVASAVGQQLHKCRISRVFLSFPMRGKVGQSEMEWRSGRLRIAFSKNDESCYEKI